MKMENRFFKKIKKIISGGKFLPQYFKNKFRGANKTKEETSETDEEFLKFECVSHEECRRTSKQISDVLYKESEIKTLEDHLNTFTSCMILGCFRNVALKSYRKEEFCGTMPEMLKPFIDRGYSLEVGREKEHHKNRVEYINYLEKEINRNPIILRDMESYLLGFFINNIIVGKGNLEIKSNALLQFKQLEANIGNLYALLSLRNFGKDAYIVGIGDSGDLYVRRSPKTKTDADKINYYTRTHPHAVVFMNLDPEIIGQLIPNRVQWAKSGNRFDGLKRPGAGMLGFEMLRAGQENKYFHSSQPHEIIIDDRSIKKMTVIDVPPNTIYYKTRFSDDSISVGAMALDGNRGSVCSSDLISQAIVNPEFHTNQCYFLIDLAGSIARDMFVCVERDKFYQRMNIGAGSSRKGRNQNRIIWLPRFKINLRQEPVSPGQLREYIIKLSPSHVTGHRRRCENPSERQIELARSLGIRLPPGYTYVREHDRAGSEEFSRFYKSRSAMSLLYGTR